MSYCVNCGVELDASAVKCVLCNTPVYNPKHPPEADAVAPYSDKIVLPPQVRRRFSAFIASMVLLLPNIVCILTNLLFRSNYETFWAKYVLTASALCFVLFLLPFLCKKPKAYAIVPIDSIAILGYIFFFYHTFRQQGWFFGVAVPVVLVLAVFATVMIEWVRRKKPGMGLILFALFMQIGVYILILELSLDMYFYHTIHLGVSIVVAASCLAIALFFLSVQYNKKLHAWMTRNFFV